jgi:hypothetical protein
MHKGILTTEIMSRVILIILKGELPPFGRKATSKPVHKAIRCVIGVRAYGSDDQVLFRHFFDA